MDGHGMFGVAGFEVRLLTSPPTLRNFIPQNGVSVRTLEVQSSKFKVRNRSVLQADGNNMRKHFRRVRGEPEALGKGVN
jgi:hypothetical protein